MRVAEVVQRGAALLDKKKPGWEKKIDLDRLSIQSADDCVLGQVFADSFKRARARRQTEGGYSYGRLYDPYSYALDKLKIGDDVDDLGFDFGRFSGSTLTRAWKKLIEERRGAKN